ncbi:P-loop containing nucleoside triphosphate hydrolase protein [Lentinula raphanica]|nr:P-loop containing nucleoside triphosphate hydrolase protein [Lentinula raphanica]
MNTDVALAANNSTTPFSFRSQAGHTLIAQIVQLYAPFRPHDHVLDGIGEMLDGKDLVAITPTGSGKTGYISFTALVVRELTRYPEKYPEVQNAAKRFPKNPLMLAICPTNYLEYQLMSNITLDILIINKETKEEATRSGSLDLWVRAVNDISLSVLLLSPEQLKSDEFARALKDERFFVRLYSLAVDEIHLLLTWGRSFRKPFQQIGLVRSRLPDTVTLMGLTATMRGGTVLKSICQFLGLKNGKFHLIRRSNQRHDIHLIFREISSSIEGTNFPELQWIIRRKRKTVIFCQSIGLGNRVHQFLYKCDKALGGDPRTVLKRIREYHSLSRNYNETTRTLMQSGECNIVIATSALAVGVDIDNVEDVVVFGDPEDTDQLLQMISIIYFNINVRKRAEEALGTSASMKAVMKSSGSDAGMDEALAELYLTKCKIKGIDQLYDNPLNDEPCSCPTCVNLPPLPPKIPCQYSGCALKLFIPNVPGESAGDGQKTSDEPKKPRGISLALRSHGMQELRQFRLELFRAAGPDVHTLPSSLFFTDKEMKKVLDNFNLLKEASDVTKMLEGFKNKHLMPHDLQLFEKIQALRQDFQRIQADEKRQKEQKNRNIE